MFYFLYGKWALRGNDYSDVKIQELANNVSHI